MTIALDFGSLNLRCLTRRRDNPRRLRMFSERAEYIAFPDNPIHSRALQQQHVPAAVCDGSLVVFGNETAKVGWLGRQPAAALLPDGEIPVDDPPARQILSLLVSAMLPKLEDSATGSSQERPYCAMTVPGGVTADEASQSAARRNLEFLARLVRMQGYEPFPVNASEAAVLATGSDSSFTGIMLIVGAEYTEICISRLGIPVATRVIPVGTNWVDREVAVRFQIHKWDDNGQCFVDIEGVRTWKKKSGVHLRNAIGERAMALKELYSAILKRAAVTIREMMMSTVVRSRLPLERMNVICCGGGARISGFANALTEQLIEQEIADRILSIRTADDADTAVVRGALIHAELEASRTDIQQEDAA